MEQQQTLEGSEQTASSALLPKTPPPPELSVAADEISSYRLKQPASLPKTPSPPHLSPAKEHAFTFKNSVPQMTLPLNSSLMQQNVSSESCLPFGKPSQPASLLRTSPVANLTSRLDSTLLPQKFSPPATVPRTMLPPKVCATESCLNLSKADLQVSSLENLPSPQLCSEEQTAVKKGAYSGQFPLTPTPKIAEGEDSGSHNVAHPASLPKTPPPPPELPPEAATALPPQKPELKLTHVLNPKGIALSWYVVNVDPNCAPVHSYHLYAYHEESNIKTSQWKKLGEIKALPLPMACTLSQFVSGSRYHFAVRAKDIYGRYGPFCDIKSTSL
ncbi:activating transcription factor 7-interacting protein 2 [Protopterus annectens]|uniref:activating transcription factor 7-interacting protein 2 n=1 Tax=Protopterus annectens TaxID=7888 RepID=UPI001CF95374|nr:activating transcription factor 7-interacting protein 2 [Protopterus annectens]